MKTFHFTVASRNEKGELEVLTGLTTPIVTANTITEAIHHPDTVKFCQDHKCTVYEVAE